MPTTSFKLQGQVVKGFGRGGKELGCPTANFEQQVVDTLPDTVDQGVFYGWAQVNDGPVYKAVMSIGWNPYYKNEKRSAEVHILHEFEHDFYGETMRMLVCGYIRPERNFDSLDALIAEINNDIRVSKEKLDQPEQAALQSDPFFA